MSFVQSLLVLISVILVPKAVFHSLHTEVLVIWNTGYSQYMTRVEANSCMHIDPGGTAPLPRAALYKLCGGKSNSWIALHDDRFHTRYTRELQRIFLKFKEDENLKRELDLKKAELGFVYRHEGSVLTTGHLDSQHLVSLFLGNQKSLAGPFLILPNHGQPKGLTQPIVAALSKYKMRISGSQSRKYIHHTRTEQKFQKSNAPIIFKNIWGHVYLEKRQRPDRWEVSQKISVCPSRFSTHGVNKLYLDRFFGSSCFH